MAGGTWTTQNKVRPGVYINMVGDGRLPSTLGERGTTALALALPWGPSKTILKIEAGDNLNDLLGYDIASPQLLLVREALKRAKTLLLYRLNTGTKAAVTSGNLTVTAKHGGVRGNDLSVVIEENVDLEEQFDVTTLLSGVVVDVQTVAAISGLIANNWVTFGGTGALAATAGAPLVGGADGAVIAADHSDFLTALELQDFQTVAYTGADTTLKGVYSAFVRRQRDDEGKYIQAVVSGYPSADYEGVISVKNGVILADGTALTAEQATAWVAGATAAATVAQSLTYAPYDGAIDANPRYTNSQIIAAIQAGEFVFTAARDSVIVETDINTLTTLTPERTKPFTKNRVLRVLDGIGNDLKRIGETYFVGKTDNNEDGRLLYKSSCVTYMTTLQNIGAIQNFNSQTDVLVFPGEESDSIYVEVNVQPVDAIEKIYMKVMVK